MKGFKKNCSNQENTVLRKKKVWVLGCLQGAAIPASIEVFPYSGEQIELADFTNWLAAFLSTLYFINTSRKYIDIKMLLNSEKDIETPYSLVNAASAIEQTV